MQALAVDSQNNLYVAGTGFNLVTAGSSAGDWWIKKFSSTAIEDQVNWNKKFDGGTGAVVNHLVIDAGDNVYAAGYGYNLINGSSGYDWWIKKFSSTGTEDTGNWDKKFGSAGSGDDVAYSIGLDSSNNVYVVGNGTNLVSASSGPFDAAPFVAVPMASPGTTRRGRPGRVARFTGCPSLLFFLRKNVVEIINQLESHAKVTTESFGEEFQFLCIFVVVALILLLAR